MAFSIKDKIEPQEDFSVIAKVSAMARLRMSAREHLLFIRDMYKQQMLGIPIRIKKHKNEIITTGICFAFITGLVFACIMLYGLVGVILSIWIIYWIAMSIKDLARTLTRYLVMTESKALGLYHRFTDNFSYKSEERYCAEQIKCIEEKLEKIDTLEGEELEKFCREMLEYEYIERRAYAYLGSSDQRMI